MDLGGVEASLRRASHDAKIRGFLLCEVTVKLVLREGLHKHVNNRIEQGTFFCAIGPTISFASFVRLPWASSADSNLVIRLFRISSETALAPVWAW